MSFNFGKNWISFSEKSLTNERIDQAREDFGALHEGITLQQKKFLDIGFGQGLSLLLAAEHGADTYGIDIDEDNLDALRFTMKAMGITKFPSVKIASILDDEYLEEQIKQLEFDVVHSWGVLHHTGDMATALRNSLKLVADDGYFVCAIYNKHWTSPLWKIIKWLYNYLPSFLQRFLILIFYPLIFVAKWLKTGKNPFDMTRGMEFLHNVIDWIGGYPYEYAEPDEFIQFVCSFGFECVRFFPAVVPTGCNEFVFKKTIEGDLTDKG